MFLKLYLIALPVFAVIDMLWVGVIAHSFYDKQIGFLMKSDINWIAVTLFYLLFMVGLVIFVLQPSVEKGSWMQAMLLGGLLGLITYGVYDLTNLALLKDWPVLITIVDMAWGATAGALASVITYFIAIKI